MQYRRIVAKCGTSLLTAGSDRLDVEAMSRIVAQVVRLRATGFEMVLVSSGARAAGRHAVAHVTNKSALGKQALASIGQSRLMATWDMLFDAYDVNIAQVLLTRRDLADRLCYLNARNTIRELIAAGVVPIVNENDAVALDEVLASRIGENDSLSAYVANLIDADLLVLLTDVDGLYDRDPRLHPDARLLDRVERIDTAVEAMAGGAGTQMGTGGMATKLQAARIATQGGVDVAVVNGHTPGILERVAHRQPTGTLMPAAGDRLESRKRWILGNINRGGHIVVDQGAVTALRERGRSLLPAGIAEVNGVFGRGESIEVRTPAGERLAAGQVNYGADEVRAIRGLRSDRIAERLGYSYGDEVIHRDNLILL